MKEAKDPFRDAEHWTDCPKCGESLGWNTEDGLHGQRCGCGHIFTAVEQAVYELLARFRQEAQGPGPIWAGAAKDIVRALEQKTPEEAVGYLAKARKSCGKMTVSCFYAGAVNTLRTAFRADKRQTLRLSKAAL